MIAFSSSTNPARRTYFFWSCLLFGIEICIATLFKDTFIRPIFGDYLVVILLYTIARTITPWSIKKSAILMLLLAYSIEILQWINILKLLGWKRSLLTDLILGSSFDWLDMLAYTLGIVTVVAVEYWRLRNEKHKTG